jgi:hypothetical protein
MLGLFTFTYATIHLSWYVGVDQFFDLQILAKDVTQAEVHGGGVRGLAPARAGRGHVHEHPSGVLAMAADTHLQLNLPASPPGDPGAWRLER